MVLVTVFDNLTEFKQCFAFLLQDFPSKEREAGTPLIKSHTLQVTSTAGYHVKSSLGFKYLGFVKHSLLAQLENYQKKS